MGIASFFKNLFGSGQSNQVETTSGPQTATSHEGDSNIRQKTADIVEKAETAIADSYEMIKEKAAPIVERAEDFAETAKEKISDAAAGAGAAIHDFVDDAKDKIADITNHDAKPSAKEKFEKFADNAEHKAHDAASALREEAHEAGDNIRNAIDNAGDKMSGIGQTASQALSSEDHTDKPIADEARISQYDGDDKEDIGMIPPDHINHMDEQSD